VRHHRTYVFLGPSLPVAEARRLLDAVYLPPVAVGDLYRLVRDARPVRVAIVDGYFERMAAVWHKEILFALEQRCAVFGAASMGALRAAELEPFGMVGVGRVFTAFRRGALTCDDEVAVAHLPGDHGYAAASSALVELRAGLALARRRRLISAAAHDRLVALARARFYRERSWPQLLDDARAAGVPVRRLAALVAREGGRLDVKAGDARALFRRLARAPEVRPARPRWRLAETWFWRRFTDEISESG
jgi:hypothetical protein